MKYGGKDSNYNFGGRVNEDSEFNTLLNRSSVIVPRTNETNIDAANRLWLSNNNNNKNNNNNNGKMHVSFMQSQNQKKSNGENEREHAEKKEQEADTIQQLEDFVINRCKDSLEILQLAEMGNLLDYVSGEIECLLERQIGIEGLRNLAGNKDLWYGIQKIAAHSTNMRFYEMDSEFIKQWKHAAGGVYLQVKPTKAELLVGETINTCREGLCFPRKHMRTMRTALERKVKSWPSKKYIENIKKRKFRTGIDFLKDIAKAISDTMSKDLHDTTVMKFIQYNIASVVCIDVLDASSINKKNRCVDGYHQGKGGERKKDSFLDNYMLPDDAQKHERGIAITTTFSTTNKDNTFDNKKRYQGRQLPVGTMVGGSGVTAAKSFIFKGTKYRLLRDCGCDVEMSIMTREKWDKDHQHAWKNGEEGMRDYLEKYKGDLYIIK